MLVRKSSFSGLFLLIFIISTSPMFGGLDASVVTDFIYVQNYYTWVDARQRCQREHRDMAFIDSNADKKKITFGDYNSWVGLTKKSNRHGEETWTWNNGEEYDNEKWATGQPEANHSCAYIHYRTRKFHSTPCHNYFFFHCEKKGKFTFVAETKTWNEAWEYCLKHFEDLANIKSSIYLLKIDNTDFPLWINTTNEMIRTQPGNQLESSGNCFTIMAESKTIAVRNCGERFPFACMNDNGVLVKEKKNWEEALKHCRKLGGGSHKMVSVKAGEINRHLRARASLADTEQVWVGLRFLGGIWFWTDGQRMSHPDLPTCPLQGRACGVLSKGEVGLQTADCEEKKNFFCYSPVSSEFDLLGSWGSFTSFEED